MKVKMPNQQIPVWVEKGISYNQSTALLRKLAKQHGYEHTNDLTNWKIDSIIDQVADLFPSFSAIPLKQAYDDKGLETYITLVKELAGWLDKILTANKKLYIKYIANIRISAADFAVASLLFTYIYNDSFGGGPTFYEKGKEIIQSHAAVFAYVKVLEQDLTAYLNER